MYRAVTHDIQVTVTPSFLPDRSSAEHARYFWAYKIEIVNLGKVTVQLKTRHWKITDAHGKLLERAIHARVVHRIGDPHLETERQAARAYRKTNRPTREREDRRDGRARGVRDGPLS